MNIQMNKNQEDFLIDSLLNFTKAYHKSVGMDLYQCVLTFLNTPLVMNNVLRFKTLSQLVGYCISQNPDFVSDIKERAEESKTLITHLLGIALVRQCLIFDINEQVVTALLNDDCHFNYDRKSYYLGNLFKGITYRDFLNILSGKKHKIVVLQKDSVGKDIDFSFFEALGDITYYNQTKENEIIKHSLGAEVIVTNKNHITSEIIDQLPDLRLICLLATGYNNIDIEYAKAKGIKVANVSGYSTDSVVQETFALALELIEHIHQYDQYVKQGSYSLSDSFSFFEYPIKELSELVWGIVGLGAIGRKTASIAQSFGAHVQYYSVHGPHNNESYPYVDFKTLLETSDIISIHAPLNDKTYHMFNKSAFHQMKDSAYLINVARGPIVDEQALSDALNNHEIAGAGLDVFEKEPLPSDSPLFMVNNKDQLIMAPHIGWGSKSARERLVKEVYLNIEAFFKGEERNIVQ